MIQGVVSAAFDAMVTLPLRARSGQMWEIEAVIDTGFNGFMTLPPALVVEMGLPFVTRGTAFLAEGEEVRFNRQG